MKLTDIKRQNIINAAVEEFRQHGFEGARTTRIAKIANVSSRTLYNHFESKEFLFDAIAKIMVERVNAMEPVPYEPGQPLSEQLIKALNHYVAIITDDETIGLNRMVNSELLRDMERARTFYFETMAHDYPITQLIAEAMAAGAMRKTEPEYAATQLLGLIKSFYFWPKYLVGEQQEAQGIMEDCVAMFLSHYQPE